MIPEDSMLRRHYLTEWRNNQDKQLLKGLCNQEQEYVTYTTSKVPDSHPFPVWTTGMFIFILVVLFL